MSLESPQSSAEFMVEITAFMDARANEGLVQRLEATHKGLGTWFKDWLKKNP